MPSRSRGYDGFTAPYIAQRNPADGTVPSYLGDEFESSVCCHGTQIAGTMLPSNRCVQNLRKKQFGCEAGDAQLIKIAMGVQ